MGVLVKQGRRIGEYSGLTKTSTALPRLAVIYLYCLRLRCLVLIFVNPLYRCLVDIAAIKNAV